MSRPNVLIFGLGGIGGIYACILHLSGACDVSVVARSNYEAVKSKGFRMVSDKFGTHEDIKFAGGELRRLAWGIELIEQCSRVAKMLLQVAASLTSVRLLLRSLGAVEHRS